MGGFSIWHWLIVGIIILLLFGKGRFSEMMGDVAKGLKSFKKGMSEDEESAAKAEQQRRLSGTTTTTTTVEAPPPAAERAPAADPVERREP